MPKISNDIKIVLIVSIFVALIIMIVVFVITKNKIAKIKNKFDKIKVENDPAFQRKNYGQLLWNIKSKYPDPTADLKMEFLINTAIRNKYKTFHIIGQNVEYESISLKKMAKLEIASSKYDFLIVKNHPINDNDILIKKYLKNINSGGMIVFLNPSKKEKIFKNLIYDLKIFNIRYEWIKMESWVLLVAK